MTKKELIDSITQAFTGVTLEDGIGLKEANAMDNPMLTSAEMKKLCQEQRRLDEKEDWQMIAFDDICERYESAFFYFDAKGIRFHLPKYLLAHVFWEELQEKGIYPTYSVEDFLGDSNNGKFELLNHIQIQAIITYLEYKVSLDVESDIQCGIKKEVAELAYDNSFLLQKWKRFSNK